MRFFAAIGVVVGFAITALIEIVSKAFSKPTDTQVPPNQK